MKTKLLLLLACLTWGGGARAALIYSGVQNVPIPLTFDGVYLRSPDGTVSGGFPADWNTAPWINPFFGGVAIANGPLLRPIITGTDQILNLAVGTPIDSGGNFVAGESGSSTHVGAGAGQFALGSPGIIGFAFKPTAADPESYGWLRLIPNNTGPGSIVDWAYQSTPGAAVLAGVIPGPGTALIPEPGSALFGVALLGLTICRRHRHRVEQPPRRGLGSWDGDQEQRPAVGLG